MTLTFFEGRIDNSPGNTDDGYPDDGPCLDCGCMNADDCGGPSTWGPGPLAGV